MRLIIYAQLQLLLAQEYYYLHYILNLNLTPKYFIKIIILVRMDYLHN